MHLYIYIFMTFSVSIRYRLFEPAPKSYLVGNDRGCSNHFVNLSRLNSFSSVFRLKRSDFCLAHWCWGSKRSTFKHLGARMTRWNNMTADKQQRVDMSWIFAKGGSNKNPWIGKFTICEFVEFFRSFQLIIHPIWTFLYHLRPHHWVGKLLASHWRKKYGFLSIPMWYHSFWWISKMLVPGTRTKSREWRRNCERVKQKRYVL